MSWRAADPQNPGKTLSGKPLDGQVMWGWMLQNGVDMPSPTVPERNAI